MRSTTGSRFSILPEGEFKEEVFEWSDIEAMCRAGRLSPNTLVFLPDENAWKKLSDTELAGCFEKPARSGGMPPHAPSNETSDQEGYESLLEQIRLNPSDVALRLSAAELALEAGKTDVARDHYQRALESSPYHPRVAQEAKRRLPLSKWKSLRYLEKPPQVWETPSAIFAYPCSRGPLYLAVPAVALTGLFWTVWTAVPALLALSLWAMEIVRTTSRGENRTPLWHGLVGDPLRRIVRPAFVTVLVAAELSALFIALAGILVVTRMSGERNVFLVIERSPVLTVLLCTLVLSYFPAVVMLAGASARGLRGILNPKQVVSAIRAMESEYLVSASIIAVLFVAMWGVGAFVDSIPVVGRVFYAAATVYILLCSGFVLGRLYGRFGEKLDALEQNPESDAQ